jgi:hypothetical protein
MSVVSSTIEKAAACIAGSIAGIKKPRPVKGGALNRVGGTLLAGFAFAAVAHRFDAAGGFLRGGERFLLQRDFNVTLPDAGGVSVLPRVLRVRRTP